MTPILITDRLVIRRPKVDDWPQVRDFLISERSAAIGLPRNERDAWLYYASVLGHWEMCGFGMFTTLRRDDQTPVGFAGPWFPATWPKPELAIHIFSPQHEGGGYASEAMRAMLTYLFSDLGWTAVASFAARGNHRQRRMLSRLGAVEKPGITPPEDPLRSDLIAYCFEKQPWLAQQEHSHD